MTTLGRRTPDDKVAGHGLLGVLMLGLAVLLAVWWGSSVGLELPGPRALGELVGLGEARRIEPDSSVAAAGQSASASEGAAAPFCQPGQQPTFVLGIDELRRRVGGPMGEPLECEHTDPQTGDALQRTTTGLAYYRKHTNTPSFTDGWRHWALTPSGLMTWEGESADPSGESGQGS